MVLLKPASVIVFNSNVINLHSTMVLLKRDWKEVDKEHAKIYIPLWSY